MDEQRVVPFPELIFGKRLNEWLKINLTMLDHWLLRALVVAVILRLLGFYFV